MKILFVMLAVAAVSGLTALAYRDASAYRALYKNFMTFFMSAIITLFLLHVLFHVLAPANVLADLIAEHPDESASSLVGLSSDINWGLNVTLWWFIIVSLAAIYMTVLYFLPVLLGKAKIEIK